MKNGEIKRKMCKMCGKKLPEEEMFNKISGDNCTYYLCCQLCYEQFTGKIEVTGFVKTGRIDL